MNLLKTSGDGKLYDIGGFLVPVVSGTWQEMGQQYGALMLDHMQKAWDVLVAPSMDKGLITDEVVLEWATRAHTTCSTRNKKWYEGVAEGTGWTLNNVCFLDTIMEFGVYQMKCHSFAGCTSILAWGSHSSDGGVHIGRNMDWSETFNEFPQVMTVRKPTDGSYRYASVGWPGMFCAFTALNEHGVYLDLHDGTSMGGSLIYKERPSMICSLTDIICESESLSAMISRLNGTCNSVSIILSIADEKSGASMECSSLAGNRIRKPGGNSMAVANTFFAPDWGLGARETVSNSLRRAKNMTAHLAENEGKINAEVVRNLMDLRLFNKNGSFAENGGCTKPTNQDADLTCHTVVTDVKARKMWIKVPVPQYFQDWTEINVGDLWA